MELNSLIFPKCASSLSSPQLFGRIIYVPQDSAQWLLTAPFVSSQSIPALYKANPTLFAKHGSYKGRCIPCLFIPSPRPSSKVMLYFHGNAEDAAAATDWLTSMARCLHVHILAMEYEGYGVYPGSPSAQSVIDDAETVYRYLLRAMHVASSDILLYGRSIGSGPACHLAANHHPYSLILMSAFTSIRAVAKKYVGPLLQYLVAERFDNKKCIAKVKCPVFMVHGKRDDVVPCEHSIELSQEIKGHYKLCLSESMNHNSMNFCEDILIPLKVFHNELAFSTKPAAGRTGLLIFPLKAFNMPK